MISSLFCSFKINLLFAVWWGWLLRSGQNSFSVCVGWTCFYGVQIDFSWQLVCPSSILCRPEILQGCGVVLHHLQSSKTRLFFCF
jgi:hypothetical protein